MSKSVAIIGTRGYPSYYGGFETAVRKLAPYLAEQGWDVTVYGREGSTRPDDDGRDPRVHTVTTRGLETKSVSTLSYGFTATRHAAKAKPDVALVMNVANGFFLPTLTRAGIPSLVNVDGIEWDRAKWGRIAKFVFHTGAKWTATHGTRMVYDAKAIAARWKSEFGLDGDFIPYGGDVPGELPLESGLEHRRYALMVARFVPENTVAEFIDAAEQMATYCDVVIVGSSGYGGELEEKVAALSAANSRVKWLGHLSDDQRLLSLWQHAGAYFHGHSVGGTNPALVQAMACGAPVIARDTIYNREVLEGAGVLVQPDANAIEAAVKALLNDPEKQQALSEAALARAEESYSWLGVCQKYEAALLELIKQK
ncbi:glycosyltransferase [Subtercola vilae]|uniref:Glycosyltransferase n=1 Tax=Subtercola vilae TaxID=2056433 RepID=A0A4T2BVX6_9MICO|nr:glycosyltransferase [Subtercola vilae]TIH35580.1 glycosyltransferase [Subtercola vilae]